MHETLALQDGHKYALLSLPWLHAMGRCPALVLAEEGFAFSTLHPVVDIGRWREKLGRREFEQLANADRFLITYAPAANPGVLDDENDSLRKQLLGFHLGLLINCPFIAHETAVFVSGESRAGDVNIRRWTTYPRAIRIDGGPVPVIGPDRVRGALRLSRAVQAIETSAAGRRFGMVLTAFRAALQEQHLETRLHQFVRCIEAFVGSNRREVFADRVGTELTTNFASDSLLQMYSIRSAVEHFGGWHRAVHQKGEREKELVLISRAIQAQLLAHHLLGRFLERSILWKYYIDERSLNAFRRSTSVDARRELWGPPLDLGACLAGFDASVVRAKRESRV